MIKKSWVESKIYGTLMEKAVNVPEISRFLGIIIKMFYNDHAPPHFHAQYQNYKATFSIKTGQVNPLRS